MNGDATAPGPLTRGREAVTVTLLEMARRAEATPDGGLRLSHAFREVRASEAAGLAADIAIRYEYPEGEGERTIPLEVFLAGEGTVHRRTINAAWIDAPGRGRCGVRTAVLRYGDLPTEPGTYTLHAVLDGRAAPPATIRVHAE